MTRQALKTQTNSPQAHIYPYELDFTSFQALSLSLLILFLIEPHSGMVLYYS